MTDIESDIDKYVTDEHLKKLHEEARRRWETHTPPQPPHKPTRETSQPVSDQAPPAATSGQSDQPIAPAPAAGAVAPAAAFDFELTPVARTPNRRRLNLDLSTLFSPPQHIRRPCRYLIDQGDDNHRYCNAESKEGTNYCPEHHKLCFTRAPKVNLPAAVLDQGFETARAAAADPLAL